MSIIDEIAKEQKMKVSDMIKEIGKINKKLMSDEKVKEFKLNKKKLQSFTVNYVKEYEKYQFDKFKLVESVKDNIGNILNANIKIVFKEGIDPMKPQFTFVSK
jgi:uncharacterized protein YkuJ